MKARMIRKTFKCTSCGRQSYVLVHEGDRNPPEKTHDWYRYSHRDCAKCYWMARKARFVTRRAIKRFVEEILFDDFDSAEDIAILVEKRMWTQGGALVGGFDVKMWTPHQYNALNLNTLNLLKLAFESIGDNYSCSISIIKIMNHKDSGARYCELYIEIRDD